MYCTQYTVQYTKCTGPGSQLVGPNQSHHYGPSRELDNWVVKTLTAQRTLTESIIILKIFRQILTLQSILTLIFSKTVRLEEY